MTDYEFNQNSLGAVLEGGDNELSELEAPSGDLLGGAVDWT